MFVNRINNKVSLVSENGYNIYCVNAGGKNYIIGGMPKNCSDIYREFAKLTDGIILLTSKPEYSESVGAVIKLNPNIEIISGTAALRNIKEILNAEINGKVVKDGMEIDGIRFLVTPNLHWVDTVMAIYDGILFSGEAFSGFDGTAVGLKKHFDKIIAVNKSFAESAVRRFGGEKIDIIAPSKGMICPQGIECVSATPKEVFKKYLKWSQGNDRPKTVAVIYSSVSGFTKELAEYAAKKVEQHCNVKLINVDKTMSKDLFGVLNDVDAAAIGTVTINRNAPKSVWNTIISTDLINKRGMPYFVFGSYGWAGDGIQLIDKTLYNMGMRRVSKPVDVLFKPTTRDFERIAKAMELLLK